MSSIRTIGVCGAGVMGSQLAAFFASAGFKVLLYDLEQELAEKGIAAAVKAKPAAFYHRRFQRQITPCNYGEHLELLGECDWVIEAIGERLDWKTALYEKVTPHLKPEAILSSNTSGLPLRSLAETLSADLRQRFLITHFFNPPRYMRLVELVPGTDTAPEIYRSMQTFLGETLGKGVVEAKDTPNFIANRIGIFGMMLALKLTTEMRLSVEQVDAITGPVMGRPKSATYRTADLVGLDTLAFVAQTAHEQCQDDESRELFQAPPILAALLERQWLGQKTGQGFYKKEGKDIFALDFESLDYRPRQKPRMDGIGVARRFTNLGKKLHALVYNPDAAGQFAWELTIGTLAYAANRVGEIADDIVQVDRAMKWGFGREMGPFEVWDALGVEKSAQRMKQEGKAVPPFVQNLLDSGNGSFYHRDAHGRRCYFDLESSTMRAVPTEPKLIVLADHKAKGKEILRNWSASLIDLGDGVGCVEFHSALQADFNPVDGAVLDLLYESMQVARELEMRGLVLSHQGTHFCAGANLALILELAKSGQFALLEQVSKTFQDLTQMIKYAPFPVVAAPFSMCLGGGFEMIAPCHQIVALAELYCGAVEVGVGLIPGAGGNLRVLTHALQRFPASKLGPMVPVQKAFETIAFAKVSSSAHEAKDLGYLRDDNPIVLSRDHQIAMAKEMVLSLAPTYEPPRAPELLLPGKGGRLAIRIVVGGYRKAGKISEHDALIANGLAHVLTGGSRSGAHGPHAEDGEASAQLRLPQRVVPDGRPPRRPSCCGPGRFPANARCGSPCQSDRVRLCGCEPVPPRAVGRHDAAPRGRGDGEDRRPSRLAARAAGFLPREWCRARPRSRRGAAAEGSTLRRAARSHLRQAAYQDLQHR
jgi:3-hydroxyacyl-CoA dehydrogenase